MQKLVYVIIYFPFLVLLPHNEEINHLYRELRDPSNELGT